MLAQEPQAKATALASLGACEVGATPQAAGVALAQVERRPDQEGEGVENLAGPLPMGQTVQVTHLGPQPSPT